MDRLGFDRHCYRRRRGAAIGIEIEYDPSVVYYESCPEFTFPFNRRSSRSRGKLFFGLLEQAVAIPPVPNRSSVKCAPNYGTENRDVSEPEPDNAHPPQIC